MSKLGVTTQKGCSTANKHGNMTCKTLGFQWKLCLKPSSVEETSLWCPAEPGHPSLLHATTVLQMYLQNTVAIERFQDLRPPRFLLLFLRSTSPPRAVLPLEAFCANAPQWFRRLLSCFSAWLFAIKGQHLRPGRRRWSTLTCGDGDGVTPKYNGNS